MYTLFSRLQFFDLDYGLWSQTAVETSCSRTLPLPKLDPAQQYGCIQIQAVARGWAVRRVRRFAPSRGSLLGAGLHMF